MKAQRVTQYAVTPVMLVFLETPPCESGRCFLLIYARNLFLFVTKYYVTKSDNIYKQFKNCYELRERYIHAIISSFEE